jgi:hypothetical protein
MHVILPDEIWIYVTFFLTVDEIEAVALVSSRPQVTSPRMQLDDYTADMPWTPVTDSEFGPLMARNYARPSVSFT